MWLKMVKYGTRCTNIFQNSSKMSKTVHNGLGLVQNGPKLYNMVQTWKKELNELCIQLSKRFSAKSVSISTKFGLLNMQIRNNFKNVFFIACK